MSIKELVTRLISKLNLIGTVYEANWTASTSSANGVVLTENLSLPAGTYVVTLREPTASAAFTVAIYDTANGADDRYYYFPQTVGMGCSSCVVTMRTAGTLRAQSAQSGAVTFTNLARGRLTAIRVGWGTLEALFSRLSAIFVRRWQYESKRTAYTDYRRSEGRLHSRRRYIRHLDIREVGERKPEDVGACNRDSLIHEDLGRFIYLRCHHSRLPVHFRIATSSEYVLKCSFLSDIRRRIVNCIVSENTSRKRNVCKFIQLFHSIKRERSLEINKRGCLSCR